MTIIEHGTRIDRIVEEEKSTSIGVVLVVFAGETLDSNNPMVHTVVELKRKAETERSPGQISFPAETRKVGEDETGNLLGAIAELTDSDEVVARLKINPNRYYSKGSILVGGKPADIAFMVYDGPTDIALQSIDSTETQGNGWVPVEQIKRMNGEARPLVHDVLRFARQHGVIEDIAENRNGMVSFSEVIGPDFSLKEFIDARNTVEDVSLS